MNLGLPFAKGKSNDILGVEMDEHHLKIVHLRQKGIRRELLNAVVHPVRGLFEDGILVILKQTIEKFQVKDPRAILTVPLSLVIARNIEIPSQDPDEIHEIVNLQASRHTPYARAEIIVDMMNLGIVRERYSKIVLVIVPKETVNKQIQMLERCGLRLEKVVFPPEAAAHVASKMAGKEWDGKTFGVLHMDYAFTSFTVVDGAKVLFVRGIHIGANHLIEEKSSYIDHFQDELEKSLEAYVADEVGARPEIVLLSGVTTEAAELEDFFAAVLKVKTKRVNYADYFHLSEQARGAVTSAKNVSLMNLFSSVAVLERLRVDLTSEEKKLKIQLERRVREMLKTGVLTMIILSLVFVHVTSQISFKKTYLSQITKNFLPIREGAKNLETMLAKTETVKSYLISRGNSLKALIELYDAALTEMRVSEIRYDESTQKFSVKGTSMAMSSVFAFVSNLEKSDAFKNVKTRYVTSRSENGKDVADFEINCLLDFGAVAG